MAETLLDLQNLSIIFPGRRQPLPAVRNLNFTIPKGAINCLVGESGCGKSLTCKAILKLAPTNATISGKIFFQGENIADLNERKLRKIRGAAIGMIFQEPMTSLNPALTVGSQTAEPLRAHLRMGKAEAKKKVIELFQQVGIPSAETRYSDYPHQLSGGMRQRVMIAMALSCGPRLLLADEPTTALDVTVQGQILRLIASQSAERDMAVLLITHDLGIVADIAHAVGVMYAGTLVEFATCEALFTHPLHPYTRGLMACAPGKASAGQKLLPAIPGRVPALDDMPPGCPFQPRCPDALPICSTQSPPVIAQGDHKIACWLYAV